jgi:F-type H+-transporting ATPase subunit delta
MNKGYARAFFEIAKEDNVLNECKESFDAFVTILKEEKDFSLVLNSPKIKLQEKKDLIKNTFKNCSEDFILFLFVVLDNDRIANIEQIYEEFLHLFNEANKIKVALVISEKPLTKEEEEKLFDSLSKYYAGYKVVITNKVNPTLLGGYHILVNGVSIDLSVKRKINDLEYHVLTTKPSKEVF